MIARWAGALYLLIIILGMSSEAGIRMGLLVPDDPATSINNIRQSAGLLRLGILADCGMALADIAVAALLYQLLKPINATLALMAMLMRLVQAALIGAALLFQYAAVQLVHSAEPQVEVLSLTALGLQAAGYDIGLIFFGVNCLLTGWLLYQAAHFPRWLGVLVAFAGPIYLIGSSLRILAPTLYDAFAPAYGLCLLAEGAFCLYLLIKGTERRAMPAQGEPGQPI